MLYMIYFPQHLKYTEIVVDDENSGVQRNVRVKSVKSDIWRLSIIVSWVLVIHL
jgi:hypothetical protein